MISSRANPRIKELGELKQARHRRALGLALAEGMHLVQEALAAQVDIKTLVITPQAAAMQEGRALLEAAQSTGIDLLEVSAHCYAKVSDLGSPEGIAVVFKPAHHELRDLCGENSKLVVAAGLQDPGNAGALVRVAEAAGASGCVLLDGIDLTNPKFLRATMGSYFRLPCARVGRADFSRIGKDLRLLATCAKSKDGVDFKHADYTPPVAICIGAEGAGLDQELLRASYRKVYIPMAGQVESLNAAVAGGIILYQAREAWIK